MDGATAKGLLAALAADDLDRLAGTKEKIASLNYPPLS